MSERGTVSRGKGNNQERGVVCLDIQAFKADGRLYRHWSGVRLLEENDKHYLVAFNKTRVLEVSGKSWSFDRYSVGFFPKDHLFNAIVRFEDEGNWTLYCNIASPVVRDRDRLKFIDYDIDIKHSKGGMYRVVDWADLSKNIRLNHYSRALIRSIYQELEYIESIFNSQSYIFNPILLSELYRSFKRRGLPKS